MTAGQQRSHHTRAWSRPITCRPLLLPLLLLSFLSSAIRFIVLEGTGNNTTPTLTVDQSMDSLREKLKSFGQEQLLSFYDDLDGDQKLQLVDEINRIDWKQLDTIYREEVLPQLDLACLKLKPIAKIDDNLIEELPDACVSGTTRCDEKQLQEYKTIGLERIRSGRVAIILLAGGQGTRLGFNSPKGMYNVGLPGDKSLFQLQAERIASLKQISGANQIIWYVMTSDATLSNTRDFFESKNYFGLSENDVVFFKQGNMPCLGFDGKVLLDERHKVSMSPNGNGGLYEALRTGGILEHMERNGVEYVHAYCVDNILVRVGDPAFVGFCSSRDVDVAAKVVEKILPNEAVGTICKVGNQFKVIEYSEISDTMAQKRNASTGKLMFNAGNICDHFFKVTFLKKMANSRLKYHLALKKIPYVDLSLQERVAKPAQPNGIKLERFIFDAFEFTEKFAAWEVKREDEFSPLKNADGTEKDNPTTAREALLRANRLGLLPL